MNIALRKLALLEKSIIEQEKAAEFGEYSTSPVDPAFRENLSKLMDKIRTL